ncbi:VC0807 family protein [Streptomyces sp. TS71-3]|uniref:VC0807 family protein n=1 Tax=Streptomyces sp. TS71-3 TaxID=2733862 RepID=UPI001B0EBC4F|nr:VC0807 family protein [Streptomyces sp. TS71-3]GHJ36183.1 hypothetical protein Sm713_17920 [Streptomyces sp. TS71-3]
MSMSTSNEVRRAGSARRAMSRPLMTEVVAPLALFYGLRALGASQFVALLAGIVLSLGRAVHGIVRERRVGGVTLFVVGSMTLTVVMSFVAGSPRLLLLRNGWGMAAIGLWMMLTAFRRRPPLYEAGRLVLDEDGRQAWTRNWERYEAFRRVLRVCSLVWGAACLLDSALRVAMAFTLPVDVVPVLDDVLLAVTLGALLVFQRTYARGYLRRHGLRLRGARLSPLTEPPSGPDTGVEGPAVAADRPAAGAAVDRNTSSNPAR